MTRHHITWKSGNVKTGPMTVTRSISSTCPPSCPLNREGSYEPQGEEKYGCYDQQGNGAIHRRRHDAGEYKSYTVKQFLKQVPNFTPVWRLNEGGDLWGRGDAINGDELLSFTRVADKAGQQVIAYTHKPIAGVTWRGEGQTRLDNRTALRRALKGYGGTINISCDDMAEVDRALERGYDATVVLPHDAGKGVTLTPGGRRVVTCPATYGPTQCIDCGKGSPLCARKGRDYAVGFPAHGAGKKRVTLRILNQGSE